MSATPPASAVGSIVHTAAQLDALPPYAVLLGDPDGRSQSERHRRLSIQKRPGTPGYTDYWYPSWDGDIFDALASEEVVVRFHLGPFLVLHVPDSEPAAEAAA